MVASAREKGKDGCFNSAGLDFHIDHNIICFCYYFVTEEKLRPCQIHSSVLEDILQQENQHNRKPDFDVLMFALRWASWSRGNGLVPTPDPIFLSTSPPWNLSEELSLETLFSTI